MKSKKTASLLAFFLGYWGIHRFYLGETVKGILILIFFLISLVASFEEHAPIVFLTFIFAMIEGILFAVKPEEEFDRKYNPQTSPANYFASDTNAYHKKAIKRKPNYNPYKNYGIELYKRGDFEMAKSEFLKALGLDYEAAPIHFNLACCLSQLEEFDKSLFHLSKAIEFGYHDMDRIHEHDGLAFLRSTEQFQEFVENGYRIEELKKSNRAIKERKLEKPTENKLSLDLLEQINQLGKLKDLGLLTDEEFSLQKSKILNKGKTID